MPRGSGVVIGGGFFYDPYAYPYYPYYSYNPYPYGYPQPDTYGWYPPADDETGAPAPPPDEVVPSPGGPGADAWGTPDDSGTSGLVRLLSVPDGATVSLDGRYWLEAHELDGRWFSLAAGTHTIGMRASGSPAVERRVDVVAGREQDVRFGPVA